MTRHFFSFAIIAMLIGSVALSAQDKKAPASPRMKAEYKADGIAIEVGYGAPSKKGRKIFGGLEPMGKVWRTGANEATTITLNKDMMVGGKAVKAGTYALFTIPGEKTWTVILNSEAKQWGAYEYKQAKDVARVDVPAGKTDKEQEQLAITLTKVGSAVHLGIAWDMTKVEVPITAGK
jgi:hypothetical protein